MLVQLIVLEYCRCSGIGMKLKRVQYGQEYKKEVRYGHKVSRFNAGELFGCNAVIRQPNHKRR